MRVRTLGEIQKLVKEEGEVEIINKEFKIKLKRQEKNEDIQNI